MLSVLCLSMGLQCCNIQINTHINTTLRPSDPFSKRGTEREETEPEVDSLFDCPIPAGWFPMRSINGNKKQITMAKETNKIKSRCRSVVNYDYKAEKAEYNSGELITQPGESYTIQELLAKHARGIMPPVERPVYYDNNDLDDIDQTKRPDFDLTDADNLSYQLKSKSLQNKALKKAALKPQDLPAESETKTNDDLNDEQKQKETAKINHEE